MTLASFILSLAPLSACCRVASLAALRAAAVACLLLFGANSARATSEIVIDDFAPATTSTGSSIYSNTYGTYTYYESNMTTGAVNPYMAQEMSTAALGNERNVELNVTGMQQSNSLIVEVGYLNADSMNEIVVDTNTASPTSSSAGEVTLTYNYPAGQNLTGGPASSNVMSFLLPQNDTANLDFSVTLTDGHGQTAMAGETVGAFLTPTNVPIPMSLFTASNPSILLTDITQVKVVLNATALPQVDFRVESITVAVPEPSSVALAVIAFMLCGCYLLRQSRQRKAQFQAIGAV